MERCITDRRRETCGILLAIFCSSVSGATLGLEPADYTEAGFALVVSGGVVIPANQIIPFPGGAGIVASVRNPVAGQGNIFAFTNNWEKLSGFAPVAGRAPISVLTDGRILARGPVPPADMDGKTEILVRLNPDGSRDLSFHSPKTVEGVFPTNTKLARQSTGKIVSTAPTSDFPALFRLTADGALDPTFILSGFLVTDIKFIHVLPDDRLLIGGVLKSFPDSDCINIGRLNPDGSRDTTFAATIGGVFGADVQNDGNILVAGSFTTVNGNSHSNIVRLNVNGSTDFTFNPPPLLGYRVKQQPSGNIMLSGARLYRLSPFGVLDKTFVFGNTGERPELSDLQVDETGRVYLAADAVFQVSGEMRIQIAPADVPLSLDHSSTVDGGWIGLKTVPAQTASEYAVTDIPLVGNHFYRARPAP